MSLARLATRLCLVELLREANTLAGDAVFDSKLDPIDQLAVDTRLPVLIVVTDTDTRNVDHKDLLRSSGTVEIIVEAAVATVVELPDGGGLGLEVQDTDGMIEVTLDLLSYQVEAAMSGGKTAWAELYRTFINTYVPPRISRRGSDTTKGARWAARQTVFSADVIADPISGEELAAGSPWLRLVAMLAAHEDPGLQALALALPQLWTLPARTDWQIVQAALGITIPGVRAMDVGPAFEPDPNDPDEVEGLLVEVELNPGGPVLDEALAEEQNPEAP